MGNPRSEKYYDFTGATTFVSMMLWSIICAGIGKLSFRQKLATSAVVIWCIRLGFALFSRSLREGGIDSRFTEVKKDLYKFCTYWTIQGLWAFICALPVLILNAAGDSSKNIGLVGYMGVFIWAVALIIETIADDQKRVWRSNPINRGKFINTGLWAVSRHPNCRS
jgi:steroid 5-alpha reductase family enzyme